MTVHQILDTLNDPTTREAAMTGAAVIGGWCVAIDRQRRSSDVYVRSPRGRYYAIPRGLASLARGVDPASVPAAIRRRLEGSL